MRGRAVGWRTPAERHEKAFWGSVLYSESRSCWEWDGRQTPSRYGVLSFSFQGECATDQRAHRVAWTLLRGDIPDGLTVDHLCRNTLCVNPDHMELVTASENRRRAATDTCKRGHEIKRHGDGNRFCLECRNASKDAWWSRFTPEQRVAKRREYNERFRSKT